MFTASMSEKNDAETRNSPKLANSHLFNASDQHSPAMNRNPD
ncbi:hypothetical protein [Rubinisphaera italica]|nr:hypothetical protein [Rubinisphaera italica]